ncbi:UDP-glucose 4-epimerase [Ischnura elegans]|uniref:UDP-glucose 4-epimerase n=1 Tax=Ischnura elegans TaxID=197161 RepID=UPI001ED8B2A2|nr:UDP-glucose 4-epimerase [Ischnura elegans]
MTGHGKLILVTGGAGYVGSHTIVLLLTENYQVVVVDNLSNSVKGNGNLPESLERVQALTGCNVKYYDCSLEDKEALKRVFSENKIDAVIHFAALKAVGESCLIPLTYYRNNVGGSVNLLEVMKDFGVKKIVFSSSATVYGDPQYLPIKEDHPTGQGCTNPYGKTKFFVEEILKDLWKSDQEWGIILLRYFNPVGAHHSGLIGEDPLGIPNNLMPYIAQVAIGKRECLNVFGSDYETSDGTGVRDYIHIEDLASGHLSALGKLLGVGTTPQCYKGWRAYNLGTGEGHSVLEVISAFEKASQKTIKYKLVERRLGDVPASYADATRAREELEWTAKKNLLDMCSDMWRWQSKNPCGFHQESK